MIPYQLVWLIMLLPLFAFIINGLLIRPVVKPKSKTYGYLGGGHYHHEDGEDLAGQ